MQWLWPDAYRFPPIVQRGSTLWYMLLINFALLVLRVLQRAYCVWRLHGYRQAVLSIPRMAWANVVNFAATVRAMRLYLRYLHTGRAIAWDKTDHIYPAFGPQGSALAVPRPAGAPFSGGGLPGSATQTSTLVLYDPTGPWGWLGEIYATMAGNLASHFGAWVAMPVVSYVAGTLQQYSACIYIGSTYGEPLPAAFLTDVYAGTTKVIWIYDNIWQLTSSQPPFAGQYGFMPSVFDTSPVATVTYKSQSLKRYSANAAGIMSYSTIGAPATVLAGCWRPAGTTFPWAG